MGVSEHEIPLQSKKIHSSLGLRPAGVFRDLNPKVSFLWPRSLTGEKNISPKTGSEYCLAEDRLLFGGVPYVLDPLRGSSGLSSFPTNRGVRV